MFISSNTHPPAKRCHALMKLFGLLAPVAKELRVSCSCFISPADFCHQIMIRDERTSRCSSQWRVYSQPGWQTAPGPRDARANRALCSARRPFHKRRLMRLETRPCWRTGGRASGNSASCEITRLLCTSGKVSGKQQHLVSVGVDFGRRFLSSPFVSCLICAGFV